MLAEQEDFKGALAAFQIAADSDDTEVARKAAGAIADLGRPERRLRR